MSNQVQVQGRTVRVLREDITLFKADAFVYYAQESLALGTGIGGAIAVRAGAEVQKELDERGPAGPGEVVVSGAGKLPATFILHAVGPRFQEPDIEEKLQDTLQRALEVADEKKIERLAVPLMGRGFYGVPLPISTRITVEGIKKYLDGNTNIQEVIICVIDHAEVKAVEGAL
jgi:O-acetyl-ADP-ribose deacetylase